MTPALPSNILHPCPSVKSVVESISEREMRGFLQWKIRLDFECGWLNVLKNLLDVVHMLDN